MNRLPTSVIASLFALLLVVASGFGIQFLPTNGESFLVRAQAFPSNSQLSFLYGASELLTSLGFFAIGGVLVFAGWRSRKELGSQWVFYAFGLTLSIAGAAYLIDFATTRAEADPYWLTSWLKL